MKKFLTAVLLITAFSLVAVVAMAASGNDGNIHWEVNGSTLTISGNGAMKDYSKYDCPWEDYSSSIKTVIIKSGVTTISNDAFGFFDYLTSITIPSSVTSVGKYAFRECTELSQITLPNSIKTIGCGAFIHCYGLERVTLPNSLTEISDELFGSCESLYSITLPNSVRSIGDYAFAGCASLTSVVVPNSVTQIGEHAFGVCKNLKYVSLPDSLDMIGEYAFANCQSLRSITVPAYVTKIDDCAFYGCIRLNRIYIKGSPVFGKGIFNYIIPEQMNVTIITYPGSSAETYANEHGIPCSTELDKPQEKKITLNKGTATLYARANSKARDTLQLTVNTSASVTWCSSNTTVAKVSKGFVTALKAGKATITAKTADGKTASCVVTVKKNNAKVTKLTARPKIVTLKAGTKTTIKITFRPSTVYNNKIKWKSSDKKVATVSSQGVIKAKKKGTCTITATSFNGKTAKIKVTVK